MAHPPKMLGPSHRLPDPSLRFASLRFASLRFASLRFGSPLVAHGGEALWHQLPGPGLASSDGGGVGGGSGRVRGGGVKRAAPGNILFNGIVQPLLYAVTLMFSGVTGVLMLPRLIRSKKGDIGFCYHRFEAIMGCLLCWAGFPP